MEISCGIGWYELLRAFFDEAGAAGRRAATRITILQIKEKFGGLRIYFQMDGDETSVQAVRDAEHAAEAASFSVCEACGAAGELRDHGGWMVTLCDAHWQKYKQCFSGGTDV